MSKIDLDRLIVRQTYSVPIESSQLKKVITDELNTSYEPINNILPWGIVEEHGLSFHFIYDIKYSFLLAKTWGKDLTKERNRKLAEKLSEEFDAGGTESFYEASRKVRADWPNELYVSVIGREKGRCLCKLECLPQLYNKLIYLEGFETNDLQIQTACLESKRFLEMIFESGLPATLVTEEKKLPPQPVTQFLVNDQTSHHILDKIIAMLDQATGEVLICGWVGTILLPRLKVVKQKGINVRIMTHKSIELKGKQGKQDVERAHSELISLLGKENISMSPECHFRVLVVDNKALVGSMDFNAISLTGTHREFAIYTENPEIVRSVRKYFNQVFTPFEE